jgi:hypothetical protein
MDQRFVNDGVIYFECGAADSDQIDKLLRYCLKETSVALNRDVKSDFLINLVTARNGYKMGHAFIWIENPVFFYVLIGKNPDGTDRVLWRDDPNWVCPEREEKEERTDFDDKNKSWFDIDEEDRIEENKYKCPQIAEHLPPLIKMPSFEFSEKQRVELLNMMKLKNKKNGINAEIKIEEVPIICTFKPEAAYVPPLTEGASSNKLMALNVPTWVSEEMIKNVFSRYAHNNQIKRRRPYNRSYIEDTFPYVTITPKQVVYIEFDNNSNDAAFARMLHRQLHFNKGDQKASLVFEHVIKRDTVQFSPEQSTKYNKCRNRNY